MSDEATIRQSVAEIPLRAVSVEVLSGDDAGATAVATDDTLGVGTAESNELRLRDRRVSRFHLELRQTASGVRVRDLDSTNGTFAGALRIHDAVVPPGTELTLGATTLRIGDASAATQPIHESEALAGLRGTTPVMRKLMARLEKVAKSDAGVLLSGESGTGKELAARALHELGPRADGPFVTVDCGALAPTLVASELFGHEKGAFTGAEARRAGAFEQADGGTLFLDEVGELPAQLQSALLGVLERKRFKRLGGSEELSVDVRVVSATHRDLRAAVNDESFRLDLYYRLAVVRLAMPPLRERVEDIPLLVQTFLREAGSDEPLDELFGDAAIAMLKQHRWPGNVRELRNWVEAALAIGETPELEPASAPANGDPIGALLDETYKEARGALLHDFEARYLARLLERAGGNVSKAARIAQMNRSHLNDLLRRHGLR